MLIFLKIALVYFALVVVTGHYGFSLWITLVTYFLNVEAKRNLTVSYIRSQFFPGELTLLEYNIMVVFYVLGCVAKAKGIVTKEDIQYAEKLMSNFKIKLDSKAKIAIIKSFNEGKLNTYELDMVVAEFCSFFKDNGRAKSYFFDYQLTAAMKEGKLLDEELEVLTIIAKQIGMSEYSFNQKIKNAEDCFYFKQRFNHQNQQRGFYQRKDNEQQSNYSRRDYQSSFRRNYQHKKTTTSIVKIRNEFDILGVKKHDDYMTVKKAYRILISEYHPDKFISKDVALEVVNQAKEKSQEIIGAYNLICKNRGWR